jgi:hypothetical protein
MKIPLMWHANCTNHTKEQSDFCKDLVENSLSVIWIYFLILSSRFEKLGDARDKTLVCKNRNRNISQAIHSINNKDADRIGRKYQIRAMFRILLVYFFRMQACSLTLLAVCNEPRGAYLADFLQSKFSRTN